MCVCEVLATTLFFLKISIKENFIYFFRGVDIWREREEERREKKFKKVQRNYSSSF